MKNFARIVSALFIIGGLVLLFGKSDWFPDFYNPVFMGSMGFISAFLVVSPRVFLEPKNEAEEPMSFSSFASKFLTNQNQSLLGNITDKRFGLVISRQQEKFDSLGEPVLEAESETRTALIVEVTDVTIAKTAMSEWEQTLPEALLDFFQITDESDQIAFDDNSYRDVSIRFMNFPSPDRSIDYAFVSSATGNTYLVVANSREQIYSIIDTLLGF